MLKQYGSASLLDSAHIVLLVVFEAIGVAIICFMIYRCYQKRKNTQQDEGIPLSENWCIKYAHFEKLPKTEKVKIRKKNNDFFYSYIFFVKIILRTDTKQKEKCSIIDGLVGFELRRESCWSNLDIDGDFEFVWIIKIFE